ncbi:MAG: glycosyl hydrolase family 18 protein [Cellvibrio sp.]|uniref:glycosyl hydrolase family 18 protein n=1 Tax=Cellvibrio sp. TaxID=1965322 RepID=UPI0031B401AB
MKMFKKALLVLSVLISCNALALIQYDKKIVAGFYPYEKDYVLKQEAIQFDKLTHLIYGFAFPGEGGSIGTSNGSFHNPALVARAHANGVRFIVMMGGGSQSGGFSAMAANPAYRANFVNNLVTWMRTYNYDGVNFDWEYPGADGKNYDKENFAALLLEVRAAFDGLEAELGKKLEMSIDLHSSLWYANWLDFTVLNQTMDWMGVMTYDYSGEWSYSQHASHNAPLFCGDFDANQAICNRYLTVDKGIINIRDGRPQSVDPVTGEIYPAVVTNVPANRIVMGLAFYGREFFNCQLNATPKEGGSPLTYTAINEYINSGAWDRVWDASARVPYLKKKSGCGIVSYDDDQALTAKADYIKANGLAGAMIWEITQDNTNIGYNKPPVQPLLTAVARELIGTTNTSSASSNPSSTSSKPSSASSSIRSSSSVISSSSSIGSSKSSSSIGSSRSSSSVAGTGSCAGLPTWVRETVYATPTEVQYKGVKYVNKWWTQGSDPDYHNGPSTAWTVLGNCN